MPTGTTCFAAGETDTRLLKRTFDCAASHSVADCELAESKHCAFAVAFAFAFGPYSPKKRVLLTSLRRLSAVLFASKRNNAAEEPAALTADKRATA